MQQNTSRVTKWLSKQGDIYFVIYAILAAFCCYSCAYAFRKALPVAQFKGIFYWGVDYKTILLITQVIGYMASKFIGIKVVSEHSPMRRMVLIISLVAIAELALLLFAIVPMPYNIIFLFFNGLPLGIIWGLVFSYLEGRRTTELLGTGLSASFILSSGFVKTIGKSVIDDWGFSEFWMPFITGALFFIPLIFFIWMLNQLPPPTPEDELMRTKRQPMKAHERWIFFKKFAFGLSSITIAYVLLTAYRDFRDGFMVNIWVELGFSKNSLLFSQTELPVAFIVFVSLAFLILIKNNQTALKVYHWVIGFGLALVGISTYIFEMGIISPYLWITCTGLGTYLAYVPFNSIFFDRMLAAFKYVGTAGFMIYVADSFGYLGSVGVLLYKSFGNSELSWLRFFINISYTLAIGGTILTFLSFLYFSGSMKRIVKD